MVKREEFFLNAEDGTKIITQSWTGNASQKPKALVQIAHGMAEHIQRYDSFARKLVSEDIYVFGNDHRGHGKTGEGQGSLGHFADSNGFEKVVQDLYLLTVKMKAQFPNIPFILFGHSMGSFLARRYVQLFGHEIKGLILSGTGGNPGLMGKIGKMVAKREINKHGKTRPSDTMNKLTFGGYNKKFKPAQTEFDWLTRDKQVIKEYMEDSRCGQVCSAQFYYDLLDGIDVINRRENIEKVPKELPIFLLSGDEDPVGNFKKGVIETYHDYEKAGLINLSCKFYSNARHEILNEINREEVMDDILSWIHNQLQKERV
ncbi:alpha/beta hydrolase [Salinibacillus xinjiangensis]|uniref:alpha/beta hydrolase n=1 Tax=Salinibacillus xinjiangensis TaxID=1229268 RepID=UPI001E5214ED|nr:alpha/beta hydrolase [Salinibacillus xinjiangensis]